MDIQTGVVRVVCAWSHITVVPADLLGQRDVDRPAGASTHVDMPWEPAVMSRV